MFTVATHRPSGLTANPSADLSDSAEETTRGDPVPISPTAITLTFERALGNRSTTFVVARFRPQSDVR
jgi:hypothetical protein